MERGNPAGAVEESVRWHIFTNLKADEPFVEGKDVTTTDPKVLCDDVKSPTWSRRPPVPFCQTNLEGITAARLIWKGGGYAHTEYEGSVSRDSLCARNERLGASPRQLHPQKDLLALSRYVEPWRSLVYHVSLFMEGGVKVAATGVNPTSKALL